MSAPELRVQQSIAAVLRLVHQTAALSARVHLPENEDGPATVVTLEPHGPLLIERPTGIAEIPHEQLPHDSEPDVPMPSTPELRPYPPFEVDPEEGTVAGMIGAVSALAVALRTLAAGIGSGAIVACELRTTNPATPLGLVARGGEPVVAVLGEDTFEIPSA